MTPAAGKLPPVTVNVTQVNDPPDAVDDTFAVTEGIDGGLTIFNVTFFVVLLSTVLQGATIEPLARLLKVQSDEAAIPAPLVEPVLLNRLGAEVIQFPVREGDAVVGRAVRELGLLNS